jgi:hypothetical protein
MVFAPLLLRPSFEFFVDGRELLVQAKFQHAIPSMFFLLELFLDIIFQLLIQSCNRLAVFLNMGFRLRLMQLQASRQSVGCMCERERKWSRKKRTCTTTTKCAAVMLEVFSMVVIHFLLVFEATVSRYLFLC